MTFLPLFLIYATSLSLFLAYSGFRASPTTSSEVSRKNPRKLLIIGATGGTGRQLVNQALQQGFEVTAFVRSPSKLKIEHLKLTILQGNILDYDSVEAAVRGQDAVLSALGHKRYFYPTRILSEGTQNLLKAMETHDVSRIICETSLGIGNSAGRMGLYYTFFVIPLVLPFYFWDKTRQEKLISKSAVEWVIVRPGVLTNGAGRGIYRHGPNVGNFFWTVRISRADVADFMLKQIKDDTYLRTATGVCW